MCDYSERRKLLRRGYAKDYRKRNPEKAAAAAALYRATHKEELANAHKKYRLKHKEKYAENQRVFRKKNPEKILLSLAKQRAKRKGIEFNISVSDIVIPETCPILNIPLSVGSRKFHNASPSIDRIDHSLGYISGNIRIVSHRGNLLKSDATINELQSVIEYLRTQHKEIRSYDHHDGQIC